MKNIARKVKRKFKRMMFQSQSTKGEINGRMAEAVMGRAVLTVREICDLLEIEVPSEYQAVAQKYVTKTTLFEKLKIKDEMLLKTRTKQNFPKSYYNTLKIATDKFKNRYLQVSINGDKSDSKMLQMFVEWQYLFKPRGFYYQEYFDYKLYDKSPEESEKFISAEYRIEIAEVTRDREYIKYFMRKTFFNEKFNQYVKRDYLDVKESTLEEFRAFVTKHPKFFGKPRAGTGGYGAGIWEVKEDVEALFDECKDLKLIIEEIVKQHEEIAKFNADTLNTARIYTLLKSDDEAIVTLASIRMGRKGNSVDNFHSGGVGALVDIETGIVLTEGIDLNGSRWSKHPDSLLEIKGFQLPLWNEAICAVKEAAKLMPEIRHIGWDIAFTAAGEIEFMEGNTKSNFHIPQAADQIGKKYLYEKHINDLRSEKLKMAINSEGDFDFVVQDDKVKIVKYRGRKKELTIPDKIQDKEVNIIGARAFANLAFLEIIVLPDTVENVNKEAFINCKNLKKVKMSHQITVINQSAFENCKNLYSVRMPYFLKKICRNAFRGCESLEKIYHYSMQGIGTENMWIDYDSKELDLPTRIEYIGAGAFSGCLALKEMVLPWQVNYINESVFEGCTNLEKMNVHNNLREIKSLAFSGCVKLKEIKLPCFVKEISTDAFDPTVVIIAENDSFAAKYAEENGNNFRSLIQKLPSISSDFIPESGEKFVIDSHQSFYTENQIEQYIEKFEMRTPSYELRERKKSKAYEEVSVSRYSYENGVYYNKNRSDSNRAVIRMSGDLMCRRRQQERARENGEYNFDGAFHFVKDILSQSDFAIGNLETTISPSAPYTEELIFINNTVNLNSPEEYLYSVRNASFDALNNAQNHIYDTGLRGIFETLDTQNKYQFMHLGAYASEEDKRYLMVDINGIKVAFIAHFDTARQRMKKANFTKHGREVMTNTFSSSEGGEIQVVQDVENAKAEGAEFIVSFCHWGREYINETTERQENFAHMVANAGVDYIFGSHPHCLQPYDVIMTDDGRKVPVFYSAGNLISDININAPITRDSIIGELVLARNETGKVVIESDGYYPCRIVDLQMDKFNYTVIPTASEISEYDKIDKELKEAEQRIEKVIGSKTKKLTPQNVNLPFDLKE